ncbi:MAG: hypothetical protein LC775_06385 [Acidobacteria bacterium]|nr:hypothetical protein [Acidobacteriota bacterium]
MCKSYEDHKKTQGWGASFYLPEKVAEVWGRLPGRGAARRDLSYGGGGWRVRRSGFAPPEIPAATVPKVVSVRQTRHPVLELRLLKHPAALNQFDRGLSTSSGLIARK